MKITKVIEMINECFNEMQMCVECGEWELQKQLKADIIGMVKEIGGCGKLMKLKKQYFTMNDESEERSFYITATPKQSLSLDDASQIIFWMMKEEGVELDPIMEEEDDSFTLSIDAHAFDTDLTKMTVSEFKDTFNAAYKAMKSC